MPSKAQKTTEVRLSEDRCNISRLDEIFLEGMQSVFCQFCALHFINFLMSGDSRDKFRRYVHVLNVLSWRKQYGN